VENDGTQLLLKSLLFYWFSELEDWFVDDYRLEDIERYHKKEDVILLW